MWRFKHTNHRRSPLEKALHRGSIPFFSLLHFDDLERRLKNELKRNVNNWEHTHGHVQPRLQFNYAFAVRKYMLWRRRCDTIGRIRVRKPAWRRQSWHLQQMWRVVSLPLDFDDAAFQSLERRVQNTRRCRRDEMAWVHSLNGQKFYGSSALDDKEYPNPKEYHCFYDRIDVGVTPLWSDIDS